VADVRLQGHETVLRGKAVLLFDGVCVMCNRTVRVLLRNEPSGRLMFTPIEGELGRALLARHPEIAAKLGSGRESDGSVVLLLDALTGEERALTRSDAGIAVMRMLRAPWPLAGGLLRLVPRVVRDFGYRMVARLRYRVFGRLARCPASDAGERGRIIGVETAGAYLDG
jgi:predicted DCC family thiol-disulfide oxidoreductase YuxK